jgi:hypothetical protein
VLVGRDRELAELTAAVTRIANGGALYLLTGEPGIGKTRLATETASIARASGLRAAWGKCWEAGGAPPFWPWHEAFEAVGLTFPDASTAPATDRNEARFGLFRAAAAVLSREAAREPLLLVLEDLHAADQPSLLFMEYVAAQLREQSLVVIGTYRDVEARLRPDAGDTFARLGRLGSVLRLASLSEADVVTLVGDVASKDAARWGGTVYDITRGNPLFVEEMMRDLRARGSLDETSIPLGVREIIRQRLGRVPEGVRDLLDVAAVLGVEVSLPVLGRLRKIHETLDDAIRSGLVIAQDDRIRFAHSLYREGLYHDLSRPRRQALHRDVARALADAGAPPDQVAHHLFESGPDAAPDAIRHAILAAAHAAKVFAFEEANVLLERASAAVPSGPLEGELRCRVLIAQGEARLRSGDITGREQCAQAVGIAREIDDASLLASAGLAYGAVFFTGGVDPFLVGALEEALSRMPDTETALRARVMARLAAARQPSVPEVRQRDLDLAQEAVAMARRVADRRELLAVLQAASGVLYGAADPRVRLPITLEQERLAEELGDTAGLLNARVRLAIDHLELADFASYEALVGSYEALALRVGNAAEPWRVPLMRSMLALRRDRFDESLRWQAESSRIDCERPRPRRAQAFHRICFLRAAERHAELRAAIPELRSLWLSMPYGVALAEARVASVLARLGADDEARELLERVPEATFDEEINLLALAEAVWATRDERHARQLYERGLPYQTRWGMYWFDCEIVEAPSTRVLAYLAGVIGDWKACDRLFERALVSVEAMGRRSMGARMRFELGDLLVRSDREPERARALLVDARGLASDVGLPDLVALIERRHPGVVPSSKEPARWSSPPHPVEFSMVAEGEYFAVETARGTLRFKATVGIQYLARLVEQPNVAVHVFELMGSSEHQDRGDAGELVDAEAVRAYRRRLESLQAALEDAEGRGDVDGVERARDEMETIAKHLTGVTGRRGRTRRAESPVDRARSAVQRRLKDAVQRIGAQDRELGAWLERAVRTGNYCSFRPPD